MADKQYRSKESTDPVEALIQLPSKNLQERIARLEQELRDRQELSDKALTWLGTEQLRFEDRLQRTRYSGPIESVAIAGKDQENQILKIQQAKQMEWLESFRDRLQLREQLEQAKHELEEQRHKMRLVDFESEDPGSGRG